jgi:hypothetical protein
MRFSLSHKRQHAREHRYPTQISTISYSPLTAYPFFDVVSLAWSYGEIAIKGHIEGDPAQEFLTLADALQASLQGDERRLRPWRWCTTGLMYGVS